jgi:glycosyltransferase involved in cell wall biosynthesis
MDDINDKKKDEGNTSSPLWGQLTHLEDKYALDELPKVSVIIPTFNNVQNIGQTLESVFSQDYTALEVIVVDCSDDRTLEIVKNFENEKLRVFVMSPVGRYELLNKGISQAKGEYVNFLFPGDYYIYRETLKYMMAFALENKSPDLVYGGTLLRDAEGEVKILYRGFDLELLKKGQQPTSLMSCWFKRETLKELGRFEPDYQMRGGFDLFCRFYLKRTYRYSSAKRILIDYDLRIVTRHMVFVHFVETMKILYGHFGLGVMLLWLFVYQKDWLRFLKLWWRSLKLAFSSR